MRKEIFPAVDTVTVPIELHVVKVSPSLDAAHCRLYNFINDEI